jgi:hypothetical protein
MRLLTSVILPLTSRYFFRPNFFPPCLRSQFCRMSLGLGCSLGASCYIYICSFRSLMASLDFKSLPPFVNPLNFPPGDLTISDYRNVIWPGSKDNAICMMFGAVQSCDIIHYAMAGANKIRALTIIPSATAFDSFRHLLWKQYAATDIYGPLDYGCLLTFTSRREGLTSSCWLSALTRSFSIADIL